MKKFLIALLLTIASPAFATDLTIDALSAGTTLGGTEVFPAVQGTNPAVKITANQVKTFTNVPGGSTTQVQFNSSSAFSGDSGFTYGGIGQATLALGTVTTNNKAVNITGTWNASGTTFDAPLFMNITNTASAAASKLADLQIGSTTVFSVRKDGLLTFPVLSGSNVLLGPVGGSSFGSAPGLALWDTTLAGSVPNENLWVNGGLSIVNVWGSGTQYDNTLNLGTNSMNMQPSYIMKWYSGFIGSGSPDSGIARNAAGVLEINNTTAGTFAELKLRSLIVGGSTPTATGSCTITTKLGGNTAGSFVASGACAAGTVILTFAFTAPNGWACDAHDLTTTADIMNQTAYTTTTATFTGTMANSDLVTWKCTAF